MGARVARVAVDDETWTAFRELCGATPASIRLGELVLAEVQRARDPAPEPDAVAVVAAIRGTRLMSWRPLFVARRPSGDPLPA